MPTVLWGHMLSRLTGWRAPALPGSEWVAPVFGVLVFLYGGLVFIRGAVDELRARTPGMMTLISLAIGVAFVFSAAVTLGYPGMPLWEELATLITIMLLGHWMEMRSVAGARGALSELARLLPDTATRIIDGETEEIPADELEHRVVDIIPGADIDAGAALSQAAAVERDSEHPDRAGFHRQRK